MTPSCSQFGTHGNDWQDLYSVPLNIAIYVLNIQALDLVVSEKKSFSVFPFTSLW